MNRHVNAAEAFTFRTVDALQRKGTTFDLDVYVTREMIESQVAQLATELRQSFVDKETPLFCPVLNGGAFFLLDWGTA